MKLNENKLIVGKNVLLVPYKKHHVEKYHNWMKSPELLENTASEPLSLEEEYDMQNKWWKDDDKCTFIVLNKSEFLSDKSKEQEVCAMIGDVNLFLNNPDNLCEAELELMIAEPSCRGRGLGKETAKLMMYFGVKYLNLSKLSVKIGFKNEISVALFRKLGFELDCNSEVFQESTFSLSCQSNAFMNIYNDVSIYYEEKNYDQINLILSN